MKRTKTVDCEIDGVRHTMKCEYDLESFFKPEMTPDQVWCTVGTLAGDSQIPHLQELWREKGLDGAEEARAYLVETFDPERSFVFVTEDQGESGR